MTTTASRRRFLRHAGLLSGGAMLVRYAPANFFEAPAQARTMQAAAAQPDSAAAIRAQMGLLPIETTPLGNRLVLLSGPGGNVVALHGPDGKVLVDGFVQPAWKALKAALDGLDAVAQDADRHALALRSRRQQRELPGRRRRRARAREHQDPAGAAARSARHALSRPGPRGCCRRRPSPTRTRSRSTAKTSRSATSSRRTPTPTSRSTSAARTCCTSAISFSTASIRSSTPAPAATSTA